MRQNPITGIDCYHSPEFVLFAEYLGINLEKSTTDLTITIPVEGIVKIAHDYQGEERHIPQDKDDKVDTTTLHNQKFRTSQKLEEKQD